MKDCSAVKKDGRQVRVRKGPLFVAALPFKSLGVDDEDGVEQRWARSTRLFSVMTSSVLPDVSPT